MRSRSMQRIWGEGALQKCTIIGKRGSAHLADRGAWPRLKVEELASGKVANLHRLTRYRPRTISNLVSASRRLDPGMRLLVDQADLKTSSLRVPGY